MLAAVVALAPGVVEMRGQVSLAVALHRGDGPYLDGLGLQLAEARERGDGQHRTPGVDVHGRTREDRRAWMSVLRGFVVATMATPALAATMPWPAQAACPGHQTAIVATPEGAIGLCPQAHDGSAAKGPVGPDYYQQCDVRAVWAEGGSSSVTVMHPVPGAVIAIRFAAAHGGGGATATCTNADGAVSPISASAVTFRERLPLPATPVLDVAP